MLAQNLPLKLYSLKEQAQRLRHQSGSVTGMTRLLDDCFGCDVHRAFVG